MAMAADAQSELRSSQKSKQLQTYGHLKVTRNQNRESKQFMMAMGTDKRSEFRRRGNPKTYLQMYGRLKHNRNQEQLH